MLKCLFNVNMFVMYNIYKGLLVASTSRIVVGAVVIQSSPISLSLFIWFDQAPDSKLEVSLSFVLVYKGSQLESLVRIFTVLIQVAHLVSFLSKQAATGKFFQWW